jgi:hypothetical protein
MEQIISTLYQMAFILHENYRPGKYNQNLIMQLMASRKPPSAIAPSVEPVADNRLHRSTSAGNPLPGASDDLISIPRWRQLAFSSKPVLVLKSHHVFNKFVEAAMRLWPDSEPSKDVDPSRQGSA